MYSAFLSLVPLLFSATASLFIATSSAESVMPSELLPIPVYNGPSTDYDTASIAPFPMPSITDAPEIETLTWLPGVPSVVPSSLPAPVFSEVTTMVTILKKD